MKLGILFPVDEKTPRLVWVECERFLGHDDVDDFEFPKTSHLFGEEPTVLEMLKFRENIRRGFVLDHTILVQYQYALRIDGSEPNQSIIEVTKGRLGHNWRGSVVILRRPGRAMDLGFHEDIRLADFRHVVDYFLTYKRNPMILNERSQMPPNFMVKGVKISCYGDREVLGCKPFEAVEVPRDHEIFQSPKRVNQISALLGLPLLTRKLLFAPEWKDKRDMSKSPYENFQATFLHMGTDPNSPSWGLAPMEWQNGVGSVLVVRQDGNDITPREVEALCNYCQKKLQPLFELSHDSNQRVLDLLDHLTQEKFTAFLDKF